MCTSPIYFNLATRSRYFHSGTSQLTNVSVPCGSCDECVNSSRNDYFIRMKSEYDDCISKGGLVAFVTLTYSNDNVPCCTFSYNSDTFDIDFKECSFSYDSNDFVFTFCKKNVQRFFNSLRKYYERQGVLCPFRYIFVSEYGSDNRFTQRPHFHGLIYLSPQLVKYYGVNLDTCFLRDISRYWSHGIVSASKYGLFVDNDASSRYISKYISKNILLSKLYRFKLLKDFISAHIDVLNPSDFKYKKSVDSLFRYYLRKSGSSLFILKSKNFGSTAISELSELLRLREYEDVYRLFTQGFPYSVDGEVKYIPYSMYYFRKLFYGTRKDGSFYLKPESFYVRELIAKDSVSHFIDVYKSVDFSTLYNFRDTSFLSDFSDDDFKSLVDTCVSFQNNDLTLQYIGFYSLMIRGRCFPLSTDVTLKLIYTEFFCNNPYRCRSFDDISLFSYFLCRRNYGYVFCFEDYTITLDCDSIKFYDFQKEHPFSFADPFHISELDMFLKVSNLIINSDRAIKLRVQSEIDSKAKYIRDIVNDYEYNF